MNPIGTVKNLLHLFILASLFALASCGSSKKVASASKIILADSLPPLPDSEIDLPLKIFAPPLFAKVEKTVTKEFFSEGWPNYIESSCDFRYKYRFVRSNLQVNCLNNYFMVQFTGNYQVAGSRCICSGNRPITPWISGSCGFGNEPLRRVTLSIGSQLQFLPTYQIHTASRLVLLQAPDRCNVSVFSSDITQLVLDSIRSSVNSFCSTLDATLADLQFGSWVQKTSAASLPKMNLGKYGYFVLNPKTIRVGQLNYLKDTFTINVGLSCNPQLSSDSSNNQTHADFPPLSQKENKSGIFLYLNMTYDYPFLAKILNDSLKNKVFEMNGRSIIIKNIELNGNNHHQVEMKIDFAGSNKGSIYLAGTPQLDTAKQSLTVPDISYSLESGDLAIKMAKTLFPNKIRRTIQGKSFLDVAALVKAHLADISSMLSKQISANLSTIGNAEDIRLIGLLARPNDLQAQIYVRADIAAIIQPGF
ncbi:MAG: DUF4403 family protein [Chitinophagales bacterium]